MAYGETAALEAFRAEACNWLEENCPPGMRTPMESDADVIWGGRRQAYRDPEAKLWLDRMGEKGWTAPEWPA